MSALLRALAATLLVTVAITVAITVAGCSSGEQAQSGEGSRGGCEVGGERSVAVAVGQPVTGLALLREGERWRALWSEGRGLYSRFFDDESDSLANERRISPPCAGGFSAISSPVGSGGGLLACLRPGDRDRGRAGSAALYRLTEGEARLLGASSPVGRESASVSLAASEGRAWIGWEDVEGGASRAWVAAIPISGAEQVEAIPLSPPGMIAGRPALLARGEGVLAVWPELQAGPAGRLEGSLLGRSLPDPMRRELIAISRDGARPMLAADARGPLLVFRDRRERAGLRGHLVRLDPAAPGARLDGEIRDTLRANEGPALVTPCGAWIYVLAPRSYGASSTLISVRRVEPEGLRIPEEPEMQIYDHGVRFSAVAAACHEGALHVLAAELPSPRRPEPRIRAFTLRCREAS